MQISLLYIFECFLYTWLELVSRLMANQHMRIYKCCPWRRQSVHQIGEKNQSSDAYCFCLYIMEWENNRLVP